MLRLYSERDIARSCELIKHLVDETCGLNLAGVRDGDEACSTSLSSAMEAGAGFP